MSAVDDLSHKPRPPCPVCGTPLYADQIEVPSLGIEDSVWLDGELSCPADPRHSVKAAYVELSWPAELTDEDRAWLRRQMALAAEMERVTRLLKAGLTEGAT